MVDEAKFVSRVLQTYVAGNKSEAYAVCSKEKGCDGVVMTSEQAETLRDAIGDGVITQEERAKLGFLPAAVVSGIAGDNGTKPARMKADALVKRLSALKPGDDVKPIIAQLESFDPAVRGIALDAASKAIKSLDADVTKRSAQINVLIQRIKALLTRIGLMEEDIDKFVDQQGAAIEKNVYGSKHQEVAYERVGKQIEPMKKQLEALRKEAEKLDEQNDVLQDEYQSREAQVTALQEFATAVRIGMSSDFNNLVNVIKASDTSDENAAKALNKILNEHPSEKGVKELLAAAVTNKLRPKIAQAAAQYIGDNDIHSADAKAMMIEILQGKIKVVPEVRRELVLKAFFPILEEHMAEFSKETLGDILELRGNHTVAQQAIARISKLEIEDKEKIDLLAKAFQANASVATLKAAAMALEAVAGPEAIRSFIEKCLNNEAIPLSNRIQLYRAMEGHDWRGSSVEKSLYDVMQRVKVEPGLASYISERDNNLEKEKKYDYDVALRVAGVDPYYTCLTGGVTYIGRDEGVFSSHKMKALNAAQCDTPPLEDEYERYDNLSSDEKPWSNALQRYDRLARYLTPEDRRVVREAAAKEMARAKH